MKILGLNAYHGDSSACIVIDGELICAIEEERIRRIKHWAGLPSESIKWCLSFADIGIEDIDYIAISRNPSAHLHKKVLRVLTKTPSLSFLTNRLQNVSKIKDIKTSICEELGIDTKRLKAEIKNVEHHRAHLASTFFLSPYEKSLSLTVDGFGDFLSVMRAIGEGNKLKIIDWVEYPHSLGILYTALTQFLGFWNYGDEYKVMGLSAYGEPIYLDKMRELVKLKDNGLFELDTSYFMHDKEGVNMVWEDGQPTLGRIYSDKMSDLFGSPRDKEEEISDHFKNMACSAQAIYEEAYFHMLNDLYNRHDLDTISLAGGCIQNSLANGKIYEKTKFNEVYIPPAAYDAGTAIGAAYWIWNEEFGKKRSYLMDNPYLGPEYSNDEIENIILSNNLTYKKMNEDELIKHVAKDIEKGKVIGWFQGRTEWGPRALGNRSIIVDPRRSDMQDILNDRIKRREWFRPFAPSILEEHVSDWFESPTPVPFMEKVYEIKSPKRQYIPAVTHEDGTGRLQTVSSKLNPRYYKLISQFHANTDVPILLNTSFNENEPIVNTPQQAIDCFLRTKMDILAIGNFYLSSMDKT